MTRIALVTGGTRGIGAATSLALAREGYTVAVTHVREVPPPTFQDAPPGIHVYRWDAGDYDACQSGVAEVEAELGPIDILVNNAGITRDAVLSKMDAAAWQDVLSINLGGAFNMAKAVFPGMCERRWGRIINIGSINGQAGQFGQVNYSAAKAGLHGFTKALAIEGARKGVTVNLIAPGYIATEMLATMRPDVVEKIVERIPIGRLGKVEEIARAVLFLGSEDAGYITGSTLSVNGGQHMA